MKDVKFGIFCEDISQKTFVIEFLKQFQKNGSLNFIYNKDFSYRYKGQNSVHLLNTYSEVSIIGFRDFLLDILFVGIDFDDRDRTKFDQEYKKLQSKLPEQTKNKTIIFFPVQAIEHWMLFIKYKIENPNSTKNISQDIEKISRKEAKKQIYGTYKPSKKISEKFTFEIFSDLKISWLIAKSESFKYFVNSFETILHTFNTP